jgi:oxalate decarboxylase/phosphoglucose isomerase-like protein (cupin superfamily)
LAIEKYSLKIAEFEKGDVLYFSSDWYHEVNNLTPDSMAVANTVINPLYFSFINNFIIENKDHVI